jgi:hypothetical protein
VSLRVPLASAVVDLKYSESAFCISKRSVAATFPYCSTKIYEEPNLTANERKWARIVSNAWKNLNQTNQHGHGNKEKAE